MELTTYEDIHIIRNIIDLFDKDLIDEDEALRVIRKLFFTEREKDEIRMEAFENIKKHRGRPPKKRGRGRPKKVI